MTYEISQRSKILGLRLRVLTAGPRDLGAIARLVRDTRTGTMTALAAEAELSPSTVSRFERGLTQRPHFRTVVRLLTACGYSVSLS